MCLFQDVFREVGSDFLSPLLLRQGFPLSLERSAALPELSAVNPRDPLVSGSEAPETTSVPRHQVSCQLWRPKLRSMLEWQTLAQLSHCLGLSVLCS